MRRGSREERHVLARDYCPVFIGVTGHRDLLGDELEKIRSSVADVLGQIEKKHSSSPCVILTALAEGADQLVAEEAKKAGFEYLAVLPASEDRCKDKIEEEKSKEYFCELLASASGVINLTDPMARNFYTPVLSEGHDTEYTRVGDFLAEMSDHLIVIWDHEENDKPGGTSSVLSAWQDLRTDNKIWKKPAKAGTSWQISAGRKSTGPAHGPGKIVQSQYNNRSYWKDIFDLSNPTLIIDQLNKDIYRFRVKNKLGKAHVDESSQATSKDSTEGLKCLQAYFSIFDRLANLWRKKVNRNIISLHINIWLGIVFFELFTNFYAFFGFESNLLNPSITRTALAAGYLGLVTGAWGSAVKMRFEKQQLRHIDYRMIAESIRVQIAWNAGGLNKLVTSEFRLGQHSAVGGIQSILNSIFCMSESCKVDSCRELKEAESLRSLTEKFFSEQENYFLKAQERDRRKLKRRKRISLIFLVVGFGAVVVYMVSDFSYPILESITAMAFVTAGLLTSLSELQGLREHMYQYQQMHKIYHTAGQAFQKELDDQDVVRAKEILEAVGEEAILESTSWLQTHRSRPIESPEAG